MAGHQPPPRRATGPGQPSFQCRHRNGDGNRDGKTRAGTRFPISSSLRDCEMAKFQRFAATLLLAVTVSGCSDDFLTTQPQTILTDDQVWADPARVLGVVSNFYSRMPQELGLQQGQYEDMTAYDEALWSSG